MDLDDMLIRVHPGDGLVARAKGSVLAVLPPLPDHALVDSLLGLVEDVASAPAPGRLLARRVARLVAGAEPGEVPSFGLVTQADEGLVLMLHGDADAEVSFGDDGLEHLSGRQVATWVDRLFERSVNLLVVRPGDAPAVTPNPRLRLGEGVVPGGGFSVVRAGVTDVPDSAEPAADEPPAPEPVIAEAAPPAAVVEESQEVGAVELPAPPTTPGADDTEIVAPRGARTTMESPAEAMASGSFSSMVPVPAPDPDDAEPLDTGDGAAAALVTGVLCPSGHLSDPSMASCGICGAALDPKSVLTEGPRPALGIITFDDGSSLPVECDYVLGREPESDPDVVSGRALPLVVDDPDRTMSRVHAAIAIDGWKVLLTDRGAANGTYVSGPGQDGWVPLFPNQPTPLQRGSRIRLGDREFRFDAMSAQS